MPRPCASAMTASTIERSAFSVDAGHERPVDLDRVERQVLEVRQRRVAGPEVVEHEADTQVAQAAKRPDARLGLVHQHALGDLELEGAGVEAGLREDRRRRPRQVGLGELARRQVDRHEQRRRVATARLACHAGAWRQAVSSTQRPIGTISPVSSASGMNASGGTRPRVGVLPAHERLEPDDRVRSARSTIGW